MENKTFDTSLSLRNIYGFQNDDYVYINGGVNWNKNATLILNGETQEGWSGKGTFSLIARDTDKATSLIGNPNGILTWGNKSVETIDSQGDNWIRYSNGIQICWDRVNTTSSVGTWNFPIGFINIPEVLWQAHGNNTTLFDMVNGGVTFKTYATYIPFRNSANSFAPYSVSALAIGRWK